MSVWFGSGLFLSGYVMAVFGLVARVVVLSEAPSDRWAAYVGMWLLLVLAPTFLVNRIGARHHPALLAEAERDAERSHLRTRVKVADRNARWQVWTMVPIAALLAAFAWWDAVQRFRGGVPDLFNTAYTAGVTLVLLTALLFGILLWSRGWPRMRHGGPAGAVGAVVGALVLALVYASVTILPVDATTTGHRDDLAAVPGSVSGIGWRWEAPEGDAVRQAVAAGAGLVVRIGDGVVAVDGETGEELWHHRRPGSVSEQLFTSADGDTVMVSLRGVGGATARFVALDAHTGQVRAEDVLPGSGNGEVRWMELFDDGYVYVDPEGVPAGLDPDSFARMWEFDAPEGCASNIFAGSAGGDDVVAIVYECAGPGGERNELVLVGLDPADGTEVWRYETTTSRSLAKIEDGFDVQVRASVDRAAAALFWQAEVSGEQELVVLDLTDGSVLAEGLDGELMPDGFDISSWESDNAFYAEGYVVSQDREEPPAEYTWYPYDGSEPRRTAPVGSEEDGYLYSGTALADMLVTVGSPDREDERLTSVTVLGAPWDGGEPWELEVEFERHESVNMRTRSDSAPLLRVPGALVLVYAGSTSVTGLV